MKVQNWSKMLAGLLMLLVSSCVEPYMPEVLEMPNNYLVVNGFINSSGSTNIQLLRTQNLQEDTPPPAEVGALIVIEEEEGESFKLQEIGNGNYTIDNLELNPSKKYRLYIQTTNGKEYASDYVEVKQAPAIDNVTWAPVDDEVQFYVSTSDPENDTRYYLWQFEETWQYRSAFYTALKFDGDTIVYRDKFDEDIFYCWKSENSTTIELGTSIKLNQDVISNYKLMSIPSDSEKLGVKYSVLVKQYAITREAYEYWSILKRNTENIGTLFDPLPSQLSSNIYSITDSQEPVVGYVTISSVQEKRIFVDNDDLPEEWFLFSPPCPPVDTLLLGEANIADFFSGGGLLPVSEVYAQMIPTLLGYTYSSKSCVDCRTRGTNVKPDFWE